MVSLSEDLGCVVLEGGVGGLDGFVVVGVNGGTDGGDLNEMRGERKRSNERKRRRGGGGEGASEKNDNKIKSGTLVRISSRSASVN